MSWNNHGNIALNTGARAAHDGGSNSELDDGTVASLCSSVLNISVWCRVMAMELRADAQVSDSSGTTKWFL